LVGFGVDHAFNQRSSSLSPFMDPTSLVTFTIYSGRKIFHGDCVLLLLPVVAT
jgi:hypothetical protein